MRYALALLIAVSPLAAADPGSWTSGSGGVTTRDRSGQVVSVDLRGSWVTDSDLTELAALPHLQKLDLSLTRISDHGLLQLKTAPAIADLNLYYAELITDAGLSAVKGWRNLKRLNLRGTKVTDAALQLLSGLQSLEALDAGYALITDVGLDSLASLPNLKELAIGGNKLTDSGLQPLRQMPGLLSLDLAGSQRTDSGLWSVSLAEPGIDAIATLQGLRRLNLSGTLISAQGLERLLALTRLERLDLVRCVRVADDAEPLLASFKNLKFMDLTGTAMSKDALAKLRLALPGCKVAAGEIGASAGTTGEPR
ncbi:MAG: hypothetical protein U0Q18_33135 [Bryobacteraceae bacterium]